jgi:hypothetical protein
MQYNYKIYIINENLWTCVLHDQMHASSPVALLRRRQRFVHLGSPCHLVLRPLLIEASFSFVNDLSCDIDIDQI